MHDQAKMSGSNSSPKLNPVICGVSVTTVIISGNNTLLLSSKSAANGNINKYKRLSTTVLNVVF